MDTKKIAEKLAIDFVNMTKLEKYLEKNYILIEKKKCRIVNNFSDGDCPHLNLFDGSCFCGKENGMCIGMKKCGITKIITVEE